MAAVFVFAASYNKNPSGLMGLILETANNTADGAAGDPSRQRCYVSRNHAPLVSLLPARIRCSDSSPFKTAVDKLQLAVLKTCLLASDSARADPCCAGSTSSVACSGVVRTGMVALRFLWLLLLAWLATQEPKAVLERLNRFLAHILLGSLIFFIAYYLHMPKLELKNLESEYASRTFVQNCVDAC